MSFRRQSNTKACGYAELSHVLFPDPLGPKRKNVKFWGIRMRAYIAIIMHDIFIYVYAILPVHLCWDDMADYIALAVIKH